MMLYDRIVGVSLPCMACSVLLTHLTFFPCLHSIWRELHRRTSGIIPDLRAGLFQCELCGSEDHAVCVRGVLQVRVSGFRV